MSIGLSWPDVRLSARLLIKYPGLTLVAGLGIFVAIAICAGSFAFFYSALYPRLPLDEGDRIVALENWNVTANNEERHSLHDFLTWREQMKSVVEISAFRNLESRLLTGTARSVNVTLAEITPGGFRVARVPPLLGRHLVDGDESLAAPPVLVIGYDAWRTMFAQDPAVVGREVRVAQTVHTIVGVMPEEFRFPVDHQYWTALRLNPAAVPRGQGPELFVFGRLTPGATMATAQAELTTIGRQTAAAFPTTHAHLRPQVLPYTYPLLDIQDAGIEWWVFTMQVIISLLLIVVALNVAILVYARTAMRRGEIAVRTALGASRGRIVAQFFIEALVLAIGPAILGLALAQFGFRLGNSIMGQEVGVPFWTDYSLRLETVVYTLALAVLAAAIVGVLPALQATRRKTQLDLRQAGASAGIRLGRMWTVLVVAQVAIVVAVLPVAVKAGMSEIRNAFTRPTFPAERFLQAGLAMEADLAAGAARVPVKASGFGERLAEVMRRLRAESNVAGVTFLSRTGGRAGRLPLEVEGAAASSAIVRDATTCSIESSYFDVHGARLLSGRKFEAGDMDGAGRAVIVSRSFERRVLGGDSAVGHRLRYVARTNDGTQPASEEPWYQIVGVAEDLEANPIDAHVVPAYVYHPVAPAQATSAALLVRLRRPASPGDANTLRRIAAAVDPELRVDYIRTAEGADRQQKLAVRLVGLVLSLILLTVFVLSGAGVYALMSFTVAQRQKEIGIRSALGASPRQLLIAVFSRVAWQIGLGVVVGIAAAVLIESLTEGIAMRGQTVVLVAAVAVIMAIVGCLAAFGPARRGLKIDPCEALKAES